MCNCSGRRAQVVMWCMRCSIGAWRSAGALSARTATPLQPECAAQGCRSTLLAFIAPSRRRRALGGAQKDYYDYVSFFLSWRDFVSNTPIIVRLQTYQRIRANRQRRLKLRTRKRHHTVESMLGYDLDEERREERPRDVRSYDNEDEPVDVEGDSLGWPEPPMNVDGQ